MKKIFITDYVGLSTRLEALAIAFLISERFGHQICLDWQELDALQISGTRRGSRGLMGRLNSIKLKGDWALDFDRIENFHHVNLRTHPRARAPAWQDVPALGTAGQAALGSG